MARLGGKKKKTEKEEAVRDDSPVVSAYSEEGQRRIREAERKNNFPRWQKILIFAGYAALLVAAILTIYFLEANGIF